MTSCFIVLQFGIVKKWRQNHLAAENGHILLILMRFLITLRSRPFELLQNKLKSTLSIIWCNVSMYVQFEWMTIWHLIKVVIWKMNYVTKVLFKRKQKQSHKKYLQCLLQTFKFPQKNLMIKIFEYLSMSKKYIKVCLIMFSLIFLSCLTRSI